MNDEERKLFAEDLLRNPLLPVIIDEMLTDNLQEWRTGNDKEACWHFDRAVNELDQRIRNSLNLTEEES